ncbi:MAG TPA: lamin tail domain-containing protein, partial [Prolixibacteraceae bacterium]|nr:lamin tail domain-containing protein [Prolixibacteraceae bacterium]
IEIYNPADIEVDVSGWLIKDGDDAHVFELPANTLIQSKGFLVVCRNTTNFSQVHPTVSNVIGELSFGLSSSGDMVRLFDFSGELVDYVEFGVENPWPENANGNGATLELRHFSHDNATVESWKESIASGGSPGKENSVTTRVIVDFVPTEESLTVYPNPFSGQTKIELKNKGTGNMEVAIYTISGKLVFATVSGNNVLVWNGNANSGVQLKSGIYICKVKTESHTHTSRIVLMK